MEEALEELKKAYETKEVEKITHALDKINEAWKTASEEMYKAQADAQGSQNGQPGGPQQGATGAEAGDTANANAQGDDVEDVDFEEVEE